MIAERGGGQQHDATGIATLVATAIEVYMRGDHLYVQGGIHPGVLTQLKEKAPSYIDVLTENNSVRAAAKREFEEIPIILNEP